MKSCGGKGDEQDLKSEYAKDNDDEKFIIHDSFEDINLNRSKVT